MARLKKDDNTVPVESAETTLNEKVNSEEVSTKKEETSKTESVPEVKEELSFAEKEKMLKKQLVEKDALLIRVLFLNRLRSIRSKVIRCQTQQTIMNLF